ncbi:unnamed protein product [Ectocarpus sp. CCAP 1310/34]|nr:unnamed protein product [Ectocarpus sp. CCAP 1310/34]
MRFGGDEQQIRFPLFHGCFMGVSMKAACALVFKIAGRIIKTNAVIDGAVKRIDRHYTGHRHHSEMCLNSAKHYSGSENPSIVPAWHYSGLLYFRVQRLRFAGLTE